MPRTKRPRAVDVVLEPVMDSRAMRDVDRILHAVAPKEVAISLIGESGAGKEVLARRIHQLSPRCSGPFIPINCAAIPDSLFESELFGHERGAFTGATERAQGKIEMADSGTLFLDEIGEMPLGVQAKLLRFLENRKFMRVGGTIKLSVDARLVCATLRPLEDEVKAGRFRADLFYRIQGIPIRVPPLRERTADIVPLIQEFTAHLCAKHETKPPRYARDVIAAMRSYSWPGNVRELRNVIELVCLLREGRSVRLRDLPAAMQQDTPSSAAGRSSKEHPAERPQAPSQHEPERIEVHLNRPFQEITAAIFSAALALEGGNRSRAARRLGVSLRTMQRFAARSGSQH